MLLLEPILTAALSGGSGLFCKLMEKHCGGFVRILTLKSTFVLGVVQDVSCQGGIHVGGVDQEHRRGFWLHIPGFEKAQL